MKRLLSLFLSVLIAAGVFCVMTAGASASEMYSVEYAEKHKSTDGVFEYVVYDNKYAELTDFYGLPKEQRDKSVYEIPSEVDGFEVRYLGNYLFGHSNREGLEINAKKIVVPDTVSYIGDNAFAGWYEAYGENLYSLPVEEIVLPAGITDIGVDAFKGCQYLKKINIPESVKNIGMYAFEGCLSLTEIKLPQSLETIPRGCFMDCKSLKSVKLTHFMYIKPYAFYGCMKLKKLNVVGDTEIGEYAFGFYDYLPDSSGGNLGPACKRIKGCTLNVSWHKSMLFASPVRDYANKYGIKVNVDIPTSTSKTSSEPGIVCNLLPDGKKATGFKSSNTKALKVTKSGKITTLKEGKATISAKLKNGKKFKLKVNVNYKPEITSKSEYDGFTGVRKLTLYKGQTKKLYAWGKAIGVKLKFKNSKTAKFVSKATSNELKIKGLKKGTATIKVRINGVWRKLKVKVK